MRAIAAFAGSATPQFVDMPEPASPSYGDVVCRTVQLGVCGTDREILHSRNPWLPQSSEFLVLGHECLAQVEQVGPGVTGMRPGQYVVPVVRRPIGRPRFRPDMLAFGKFTERGIVCEHGFSLPRWLDRPEYLIPVPDKLADVAVFAEPLAVAEKGINEATIVQEARLEREIWTREPPRVLVTGLGPIAFAAIIGCFCRRWPTTVYGRDPNDSQRARLVGEFGAKYISADQFERASFEETDVEQSGFDLILECTGSDEVTLRTADRLASRGVMVWLGSTRIPEPRVHNVERLMRNGILRNHIHLATVNAAVRDFEFALRDLEQLGREVPRCMERVITARVPPNESLWHYEHRQPQGIKTVLMYGA